MTLRKVGKVWVYQCKVNGKTWSRSTEESDKRKAAAKVAQLEALAQLHRDQPAKSVKLSRAIVAEVDRIEVDVSARQACRNHVCLKNFLTWLGRDIELARIDTELLERYQRDRLRKAAVATVNQELYAICAMLRQNKFRVDKPRYKPGKKTEQRDFTEEELQKFFAACEAEEHRTLFAFLLATGARPAEIIPSVRSAHVALLKKELDPAAATVIIRSAKIKPGQKKTTRLIQIPKELMERVVAQAAQVKGSHVFHVNQSLAKLFDRICVRAGIATEEIVERRDRMGNVTRKVVIRKTDELGRKVTAHSFRHTYASMMARRVSYNPHVLKSIMGHHQLSTLDRYVHARSTAEVVKVAEFLTPRPRLKARGNGCEGWV